MNQVSEYVGKLNNFIPGFKEHWNSDDAGFNFGKDSDVYGVFCEFSHLVTEQLEAGTLENRIQLFIFIESVIVEGGDPANAACTCFLENILNITPDSIDPDSFVLYLGPKSAEFCRAWDEFTGVKTRGL